MEIEKKSIRSWVTENYEMPKNEHLVRKAARVVKRMGNIGEVHAGRTGILLSSKEWDIVRGSL